MNNEVWKSVVWYKGYYEVSNYWCVKSLDRHVKHKNGGQRLFKGKILKPQPHSQGYLYITLAKKGKFIHNLIHRIVKCSFSNISLTTNKVVCHKDDNKHNNHIDNLFIWTQKDNMRDMYSKWRQQDHSKRGLAGERHWMAKLTNTKVKLILLQISMGETNKFIWNFYWVSPHAINHIRKWTTWKHLTSLSKT